MERIFYAQAAQTLGVSIDTLKQAVTRGVFSKAGMHGKRQQLIKEQVELFAGVNPRTGNKKRLSLEVLTSQERAEWNRLATLVNTTSLEIPIRQIEETVKRVAREESRKETEDTLRPLKDVLDRIFSPKQTAVA